MEYNKCKVFINIRTKKALVSEGLTIMILSFPMHLDSLTHCDVFFIHAPTRCKPAR